MQYLIILMSVLLTSTSALSINRRQNGIATCKKGDIPSKFLGPFPASESMAILTFHPEMDTDRALPVDPCTDACYGIETSGPNTGQNCAGTCDCTPLITGDISCNCQPNNK